MLAASLVPHCTKGKSTCNLKIAFNAVRVGKNPLCDVAKKGK
jgi:hypothetical protein